jgi:hypothetical protein
MPRELLSSVPCLGDEVVADEAATSHETHESVAGFAPWNGVTLNVGDWVTTTASDNLRCFQSGNVLGGRVADLLFDELIGPGDPARRPCLVSPYHYRLDWQLWFLAMGRLDQPWALNLVFKLLQGDPGVKTLLAHDPFPARPPRYLRILEYRYRFTRAGEPGTWRRELLGTKLRPIAVDDPELLGYLQLAGLL